MRPKVASSPFADIPRPQRLAHGLQGVLEGTRDLPEFIDAGVDVVDTTNVDTYLNT
jgi:hypothetical protein